jgi:two-component system OmpR family sensor kinase
LRARLFAAVAAFILVAGLVAGLATFRWAFEEAIELQDAVLLQVGALVAANRATNDLPPQLDVDDEARVVVQELPPPADTTDALLPLPAQTPDGMHTLDIGAQEWRVLVRTRADGSRVAVGQITRYRNEIASGSALRAVIPFAVLIPCLMVLVGIVIRYSFGPVARLATKLDAGDSDELAELPVDGMPEELRPFIHSINRLLGRVAVLLDQQRRFVADAAHELRSPLTALSVQAENLQHGELPPESRLRLAALRTGIRRTAHLLEQLLALAKYDAASRSPAQRAAFDAVANGVIADLLPAAQARAVDLGFERIESVMVRADATALAVVVRNLVDNALRHTPDGGRVDLYLYAERANAIFRVEDTGPGIGQSDLALVFEPFYRGRSQGEGSGLGLSIVRRIVQGLRGRVALENISAGAGLRAVVTIPLAEDSGARSVNEAAVCRPVNDRGRSFEASRKDRRKALNHIR